MRGILMLLDHPGLVRLSLVLLHFLWQGAVLASIALLVVTLLRRASPAARYAALLCVLAVMAAAPAVTFFALPGPGQPGVAPPAVGPAAEGPRAAAATVANVGALPGRGAGARGPVGRAEGSLATSIGSRAQAGPPYSPIRTWLQARMGWVAAAWFLGVFILSLRLLIGWVGVARARRRGGEPSEEHWADALADLKKRLRVSRAVRLLESAAAQVPTVIGWLRPVILLPATALSGLTPQQIEALIAHELAHIRRHDYLVNLLQTVVETLLFYHPAVWWVSNRIRAEREHCCDDLAVACCGDALAYARALADMEHLRSAAPQLVVAARGGSLVSRIRRLVPPTGLRPGRPTSWLAGGIGVAIVVGAVVAIATTVVLSLALATKSPAKAPQRATPAAQAKARSLIDEALAVAKSIKDERQRDGTLGSIAFLLATIDPAKSAQVARSIRDPQWRFRAFSWTGGVTAQRDPALAREAFTEAIRAARSIEDETKRDRTLRGLGFEAFAKVDPDLALATALKIRDTSYRVRALSATAQGLADRDRARALGVIRQALDLARTIKGERERDDALWGASLGLAGLDPESALRTALTIERKTYRTMAVYKVLVPLAEHDLEEAVALARTVKEQTVRDRALQRIVLKLAEKHPEQALQIARTIRQKYDFAYAMAVVSHVLARTDRKSSHALALESLRAAEKVTGPRARAMALRMTALALSRTDVEKAIKVAQSIDLRAHEANKFWQARAFQSIASVLAKTSIDRALAVARMIEDRYSRIDALLTVAAAAKKKAPSLWASIMREAEKTAQGIEHDYARMEALSAIRRAAGKKGAEARRIARASAEDIARIRDPRERDHARLRWAGSLAKTDPDAALKVAREVEDPYLRVLSIAGIAGATLEGRQSARQQ